LGHRIFCNLNAKVKSDCSSMSSVIGGHLLHSSSNDNGTYTRLMDLFIAHQLTIGGTMFQHKDIQLFIKVGGHRLRL